MADERLRAAGLVALLSFASGCGSNIDPVAAPDAGGDGSVAAPDADASATVGDGAAPDGPDLSFVGCGVACPAELPEAGTPCHAANECSVGTDVRYGCRDGVHCVADTWQSWAKSVDCSKPAATVPCPESLTAQGTACTSASVCTVPGGECVCGPLKTWACLPVGTAGCPSTAPNVGQPCGDAPLLCSYISSFCQKFFCKCGVWGGYLIPCE